MIWRLDANGGTGGVDSALDPTFGTGGVASAAEGSSAEANAIALEPDRRVVAVGPIENVLGGSLLVFRALGDPFTASVAKAGTGSGSVQSSPPGIECGPSCSGPFDDGSQVTLTATPAAGSAFAGWSGDGCGGTGSCELTMSAEQTVTATFDTVPPTAQTAKATKATISALRESNSTFAVGPSSTPLTGAAAARRHKRGTVFSFQLDQAGDGEDRDPDEGTRPSRRPQLSRRKPEAAPQAPLHPDHHYRDADALGTRWTEQGGVQRARPRQGACPRPLRGHLHRRR